MSCFQYLLTGDARSSKSQTDEFIYSLYDKVLCGGCCQHPPRKTLSDKLIPHGLNLSYCRKWYIRLVAPCVMYLMVGNNASCYSGTTYFKKSPQPPSADSWLTGSFFRSLGVTPAFVFTMSRWFLSVLDSSPLASWCFVQLLLGRRPGSRRGVDSARRTAKLCQGQGRQQ
jgi:hypothetical protein